MLQLPDSCVIIAWPFRDSFMTLSYCLRAVLDLWQNQRRGVSNVFLTIFNYFLGSMKTWRLRGIRGSNHPPPPQPDKSSTACVAEAWQSIGRCVTILLRRLSVARQFCSSGLSVAWQFGCSCLSHAWQFCCSGLAASWQLRDSWMFIQQTHDKSTS